MTTILEDATQEEAAHLVAEGRYSYTQIHQKLKIDRSTLWAWRQEKTFASRVEHLRRELSKAAMQRGIARKDYRLTTLADLQSNMLAVMEARSADMSDIPGGDTGLMVRTPVVSAGALLGYEYAVDTGLIRELRALQEQVAKELGQLVEKKEHVVRGLKDLSDDELAALASELSTELAESPGDTALNSEGNRPEEEA